MLKNMAKKIVQKWRVHKHRHIFSASPHFLGKGLKISRKCLAHGNTEIYDNVTILDNVTIGYGTSINRSTVLASCQIGRYCSIGQDCIIGGGNHEIEATSTSQLKHKMIKALYPDLNPNKNYNPYEHPPIIGNDVWIAAKAIILQGVSIGDGAIVASGSIVTKTVPPYAIVAGNPAKVIRYRFSEEKIEALKKWKWWTKDIDQFDKCELELFLSGKQWYELKTGSSKVQ